MGGVVVVLMALMRCDTLVITCNRSAVRSRENYRSRFSQDAEVGLKCIANLGAWPASLAVRVLMRRCRHWPMTRPSSTLSAAHSVCRAVALVVVRHRLQMTLLRRNTRLRAGQRLRLALLVAAQHQGVHGRGHVQAHGAFESVDEPRVTRDLEASSDVRPQAMGLPVPHDDAGADAQFGGRLARAPVRGRRRLALRGRFDRPLHIHLHRRSEFDRCAVSITFEVLAQGRSKRAPLQCRSSGRHHQGPSSATPRYRTPQQAGLAASHA